MVHIKIKENSKQAKAFIEFARTMSFIEFVEEQKKEKILNEIREGLKDGKKMRDGKKRKKTASEMLDGM